MTIPPNVEDSRFTVRDVDLDPPNVLINSCFSKHNPLWLRIVKANLFAGYLAFDSVASDSVLQVNVWLVGGSLGSEDTYQPSWKDYQWGPS